MRLALRLTRIVCEVPLTDDDLASCARAEPDMQALTDLAEITRRPDDMMRRWATVTQ